MIRSSEGESTALSSEIKASLVQGLNELDALIVGYHHGLENVDSSLILRHYEQCALNISTEELTEHSNTVWIRTEASAKKAIVNLKRYNDVIVAGSKRLSEELIMIGNVAEGIKSGKPTTENLTLKNPARFTVAGKFEPVNVRPILSEFQNLMDFNDKVLLPYSDTIIRLLDSVDFNDKFLAGYDGDPSLFSADKWLRGLTEVTEDDRFKPDSVTHKGDTFNANRALYYQGPVSEFPKEYDSAKAKWDLHAKALGSIKFKCLKDITVKGDDVKDLTFKVSNVSSIRQRAGILSGVIKRLLSKANAINAHLDNLENTIKACLTIMGKAKDVKADSAAALYPSENKIFIESLMLLRNEIRLTFEYYNVTSMFVKLIGSLSYICDLELKAYSSPIVKPTEETRT